MGLIISRRTCIRMYRMLSSHAQIVINGTTDSLVFVGVNIYRGRTGR